MTDASRRSFAKKRLNKQENYSGVLKEIEDAAVKLRLEVESDQGESILDCLLRTQKS